MDLTHHRFLALIATVLAALALAATPALASEPDEDDEDDGDVPAQVLQPVPAPAAPAPAPAPPAPSAPSVESSPSVSSGGGEVEGEKGNNSPKKTNQDRRQADHADGAGPAHLRRADLAAGRRAGRCGRHGAGRGRGVE